MLAVVKECYPSQGKFSESLSFRPRNFSILANCNPGLPSYIKTIMFVIQKLQTAIWILLKLEIYRGTALTNDFTIRCIFPSFRNVSNYFVVFFFCVRTNRRYYAFCSARLSSCTQMECRTGIYLFTLYLKSHICFWDQITSPHITLLVSRSLLFKQAHL